jgi:hypothetical protein
MYECEVGGANTAPLQGDATHVLRNSLLRMLALKDEFDWISRGTVHLTYHPRLNIKI